MKFDNMNETFAMKFIKYMKYIFWMKYHHVNKTNFLDETFNDALPSHGVKPTWGFHKVKLRKLRLGSTLPASNSRKG